jgi:hypothetical protein
MTDTDLRSLSPGAARLAVALSVAARIEPELIRAVRLETFPGLDVGHESELWFSDWIGAREPHAVALRPQLLPRLRRELAGLLHDAAPHDPIRRVGDLIVRRHTGLPPTLLLEEKINWLSVTRRPGHLAAIDESLESALRALVDGGRAGIADWYLGALNRLPAEAQDTRNGWLLATVTARRYPAAAPRAVPAGLGTADVERITGHIGEELLGLAWDGPDLLISGRPGDSVVAVPVPATDPRVVDVLIGERTETVLVAPDETVRVAAEGGPVRLRTATGDTFDVAGAEHLTLVRDLADEVGPAEFDAIRELLPTAGIIDAMVSRTDRDVGFFEIRLPPDIHQQAAGAFSAVARLLRLSLRQALRDQGRPVPAQPGTAFLADPRVPTGQFAVRARHENLSFEPAMPGGSTDRDTAIDDVIGRFLTWIANDIDPSAFGRSVTGPAGDLVHQVLAAVDASGIRVSEAATADILPNYYRIRRLPDLPAWGLTETRFAEGLALAIRHFAELRDCRIYGDGLPHLSLDAGLDLILCGFDDDSRQPGENRRSGVPLG